LYGVLASNLAFLPLANKLKDNASDDAFMYRFILEGLQCIHEKEYSIVIEQKLSALMPRHELIKYQKGKTESLNLSMAENS
jgi:flagellar motor component MotA